MNEHLKKYKDNYVVNNLFIKEEITKQEYEILKLDKDVICGYDEKLNGENEYYKKTLVNLTDEEFDLYLKIKNVQMLEDIDTKQKTMKNIMIFWFIITLIPTIIGIYFLCGFAA